MSSNNRNKLGVVACPGGERFADLIISHLSNIYRNKQEAKRENIASRYDISSDEIADKINFHNDLLNRDHHLGSDCETYSPTFKIPCEFTHFANEELKTKLKRSIRGMDVFIVQDVANRNPVSFDNGKKIINLSVNDHLMNLITAIDAVIQCTPRRVTLVLPTYPYSRQDKKKGREGLTASRLGLIFEQLGVSGIITLDIHSKAIENSFRTLRLEDLHGSYQIMRKLIQLIDFKKDDLMVVSPDTGGLDRSKFFSEALQCPLGLLYKERDYSRASNSAVDNNIKSVHLLGDVVNKTVFIADDMLGTGGTMVKTMAHLIERGAKKCILGVSLPFFNGDAVKHIDQAHKDGILDYVIATNAVTVPDSIKAHKWYIDADISLLFARVISCIYNEQSVSHLLENRRNIQRLLNHKNKQ